MSSFSEKVHTVHKFWDCPRSGIADFEGSPHYYECIFDNDADEWSTVYILKPVSEEILKLDLENKEIVSRWSTAVREGKAKVNPVKFIPLPEDQKRYNEIEPLLKDRLSSESVYTCKAHGKFSRVPGESISGHVGPWAVVWEKY